MEIKKRKKNNKVLIVCPLSFNNTHFQPFKHSASAPIVERISSNSYVLILKVLITIAADDFFFLQFSEKIRLEINKKNLRMSS